MRNQQKGNAGGNSDPSILPFKFLYPYIKAGLDAGDLVTATFLSERLYYLYKSGVSKHSDRAILLLAMCYFRSGKANKTYALLRGSIDTKSIPQLKFVFAQTCFELKKYSEAEKALLEDRNFMDVVKMGGSVPLKSQGFYLLGQICRRTSRLDQAKLCFRRCLEQNSFHWGAYSALCDLGDDVDMKKWARRDEIPHENFSKFLEWLSFDNTSSNSGMQTSQPLPVFQETLASAFSPVTMESGTAHNFSDSLNDFHEIEKQYLAGAAKVDSSTNMTTTIAKENFHTPKPRNISTALPSSFTKTGCDANSTSKSGASTGRRLLPDTPLTPAYTTPPAAAAAAASSSVVTPMATPRQFGNTSSRSFAKPSTRSHRRTSRNQDTQPESRPLRRSARISGSSSSSSSSRGSNSHLDRTPAQRIISRRRGGSRNERTKKSRQNYTRSSSRSKTTSSQESNLGVTPTNNESDGKKKGNNAETTPILGGAAGATSSTPGLPQNAPIKRKLMILPGSGGGAGINTSHDQTSSGKISSSSSNNKNSGLLSSRVKTDNISVVPFQLNDASAAAVRTAKSTAAGQIIKENNDDNEEAEDCGDTKDGGGAAFRHNIERMRDLRVQTAYQQFEDLRNVLGTMALGYKLLCQFKCKEAVEKFQELKAPHAHSGWVLCCLGKCYFEMVNYPKSVQVFRLARQLEPYRSEGLEYFSTSLWHLKNEVELSYLAQSAVEFDKMSPLTWIVVGNCLSLQKEHDTALKFFRRAIQLDPHNAWAYTLSAHEFVANEDFEKALCGFRQAIGENPRHYNAWYGMGNIYFRQEKYDLAAYHFQRALKINNRNTVLYCYLGMVLHSSDKCDEALKNLTKAEQLEPTNSLAKYQKANVFFSLQRYHEALEVLNQVRDFAPREASVHFLMGKVCKRLGRINDAILHFTTTLDLNPKDKNVVKSAIDKLHCGDNESQSSEEF